ncbi:MAG: sigma-70 family RNA polymerase sigma factor [Patescibacteria group bacterium]
MSDFSDNELVIKYRAGDEESLAILIRRYLRPIYFFCLHFVKNEEANDLAQEVFIKVWRKLRSFDADKNFKVWIFRIARNTCLDYLRKKKSLLFSELQKEDDQPLPEEAIEDLSPTAFEKLSADDLRRELGGFLGQLPAQSQLIFEMHYDDQMTFQEISDSLGLSLNTVKSRHLRGLKRLRQLMDAPK